MHLVRYLAPGEPHPRVGVLEDGHARSLEVEGMSALLGLRLDQVRQACDTPRGPSYRLEEVRLLPPLDGRMEVWAAGVTYRTSRLERMRESERSASVYDRVYSAQRPELFFKSAAWRVVTDSEPVAVRADSEINVPEPELALLLNAHGEVVALTVCNDMSSRSIEGENPLYLPQAKVYLGSCAVASHVRPVWEVPDPLALPIRMRIERGGVLVWEGDASTADLNRRFDELTEHLFRAESFPDGVVLATGTCLVPELPFTLLPGDRVVIEIEAVGSLVNVVTRQRSDVEHALRARAAPNRPG